MSSIHDFMWVWARRNAWRLGLKISWCGGSTETFVLDGLSKVSDRGESVWLVPATGLTWCGALSLVESAVSSLSITSLTSRGYNRWIGLLRMPEWFPLEWTRTTAPLTFSSVPCMSSSTLPNFHSPLGWFSSWTMTMSPTVMGLAAPFGVWKWRCASRSSSKYSALHLLQKSSMVLLRCFILRVRSWRVTSSSESVSGSTVGSGKLRTLYPRSRCEGVKGSSVSSDDMYDNGLELRIISTSVIEVYNYRTWVVHSLLSFSGTFSLSESFFQKHRPIKEPSPG